MEHDKGKDGKPGIPSGENNSIYEQAANVHEGSSRAPQQLILVPHFDAAELQQLGVSVDDMELINESGDEETQSDVGMSGGEPELPSNDDGESDESNTKKSRKGTRKDAPSHIVKMKERTKTAKKRGETLQKAARDLEVLTSAKVYLKAEYVGAANNVYKFSYGSDFEFTEQKMSSGATSGSVNSPSATFAVSTEAPPQAGPSHSAGNMNAVSADNIKEIVTEAVAAGIQRSHTDVAVSQKELFNSPTTTMRRPASIRARTQSGNVCQICTRDDSFMLGPRGVRIPVLWFRCCSSGCNGRAHNECIGFPGIKQDDIKHIAPWYCSIHVGCGRPPLSVDPTQPSQYSSTELASPDDPTDRSGQGKGSAPQDDAIRTEDGQGSSRGSRGGTRGRGSRRARGGRGKAAN